MKNHITFKTQNVLLKPLAMQRCKQHDYAIPMPYIPLTRKLYLTNQQHYN